MTENKSFLEMMICYHFTLYLIQVLWVIAIILGKEKEIHFQAEQNDIQWEKKWQVVWILTPNRLNLTFRLTWTHKQTNAPETQF